MVGEEGDVCGFLVRARPIFIRYMTTVEVPMVSVHWRYRRVNTSEVKEALTSSWDRRPAEASRAIGADVAGPRGL